MTGTDARAGNHADRGAEGREARREDEREEVRPAQDLETRAEDLLGPVRGRGEAGEDPVDRVNDPPKPGAVVEVALGLDDDPCEPPSRRELPDGLRQRHRATRLRRGPHHRRSA